MPGASVMPTRPQAPVSVTFSFAAQRTQGSGTSAVRPSAWSPVEAGEQGEGGEPLLTVSDLADMVDEVFWVRLYIKMRGVGCRACVCVCV